MFGSGQIRCLGIRGTHFKRAQRCAEPISHSSSNDSRSHQHTFERVFRRSHSRGTFDAGPPPIHIKWLRRRERGIILILCSQKGPPPLRLIIANPRCWLTLLRSISSLAEHGLEGNGSGQLRWLINSRHALVQGNMLLNGLIKTYCWIMAPWRVLLMPKRLIWELFHWKKDYKSALKPKVPLSWTNHTCALRVGPLPQGQQALVNCGSEFWLELLAQISEESYLSRLISVSHFSPAVADTKKLLHMQADNSKGRKRKFTILLFPTPTEKRQLPKRQQELYILSINLDWIKGWLFLFMQPFWIYHFMSVSVSIKMKWINTLLMGVGVGCGGDLPCRGSQEGCNQLSVSCEVSQMGENSFFFTSGNSTGPKVAKREEERGSTSERKRIRRCCSHATITGVC